MYILGMYVCAYVCPLGICMYVRIYLQGMFVCAAYLVEVGGEKLISIQDKARFFVHVCVISCTSACVYVRM